MSSTDRNAQDRIAHWHLGQTSEKYETSGLGPGMISSGHGDHGGVSYGSYQLSSREGTVQEYLAQSRYGAAFAGLTPATPAFDRKWRETANADPAFGPDQHDFIGRSHYRQQMEHLKAGGLDVSGRGRAVQDCVWSTSVQLRNLTPRIFREGLKERFGPIFELSNLSDRDIVEAVQDYKIAHNATLFSKSPAMHRGLLRRAHAERDDLVALADAERLAARSADSRSKPAPLGGATSGRVPATPASEHIEIEQAQRQLAHLGYTGMDGRLVEADGRHGRSTRHAVEQYQRDHGLQVTGHLDGTTRMRLAADDRTMASSTHPAHELYRQSIDAVRALDRQLGVASGPHSLALAGVAAAEAARAGLSRIDRLELGKDRIHARAVQFNMGVDFSATNSTSAPIDVARAVTQPLDASSRQAEQALAAQRRPEAHGIQPPAQRRPHLP